MARRVHTKVREIQLLNVNNPYVALLQLYLDVAQVSINDLLVL